MGKKKRKKKAKSIANDNAEQNLDNKKTEEVSEVSEAAEKKDALSSLKSVFTKHTVMLAVIMLLLCAEILFFVANHKAKQNVVEFVKVEAGSQITPNIFFKDYNSEEDKIVSDISTIDVNVPNTYRIAVSVKGFDSDSILEIADTVAPTADPVPQNLTYPEIVDAEDCVTNIKDISATVVEFKDDPQLDVAGSRRIPVLVTDVYGNSTEVLVYFNIIKDEAPPMISGAKDLEYFVGEKIIYRDGIIVTDNMDPYPTLSIDTSAVDITKDGTYPVTYIATDSMGNESSVTINLTLRKKPKDFVSHEKIYALAQKVLNKIIKDDMSDTEKAFRIFNWMWHNVKYVGFHDEMSWEKAAYDGFRTHKGNCFTYYSMCKVMLDMEGIPNMMVSRYPVKKWPHYWNLVYLEGEWYHCDSNPYRGVPYFYFMRTDKELDSKRQFDTKNPKYPKRATVSVQKRLNYKKMTISPKK